MFRFFSGNYSFGMKDPGNPYLRLAHAIDAHVPGFIDGPGFPEFRAVSEPIPPLIEETAAWIGTVSDTARRDFLNAQWTATSTLSRLIAGEQLSFTEEVQGLLGIVPSRRPESDFLQAHQHLTDLLPGSDPLADRVAHLQKRVTVAPTDIVRIAAIISDELRQRTQNLIPLPEGEAFEIALVQGQLWKAYSTPLGDLKSRIDLNTDLPVLLPELPDLLAHEGYPGHHTEAALKEERLWRDRGWEEFRLRLSLAPEAVISEGLAVNALAAIMSEEEVSEWLSNDLASAAGVDAEAVETYRAVVRAQETLRHVSRNAALLLHQEDCPRAEVEEYLMRFGLMGADRAQWTIERLSRPYRRAYTFTYIEGGELLRSVLKRPQGKQVFSRVLTEPWTPGRLRIWLKEA